MSDTNWTDRDIEAAYWMGAINGSSHEATGRTFWPSMDRLQLEAERIKSEGLDVCAVVRQLRAQGIGRAAESGSHSDATEPLQSPVAVLSDAPTPNVEQQGTRTLDKEEIERIADKLVEAELPDRNDLVFEQRAYRGSYRRGAVKGLQYARDHYLSAPKGEPVAYWVHEEDAHQVITDAQKQSNPAYYCLFTIALFTHPPRLTPP